MWSSPLFWIAVAIAVFWALGAYNRLMRLRSAVIQAFGGLDAHLVRLLALLGEYGVAHAAASVPSGAVSPLAALDGAATQLSASLAMARARPLRPQAAAALAAARDVVYVTWYKTTGTQPPAAAWAPSGGEPATEPAPQDQPPPVAPTGAAQPASPAATPSAAPTTSTTSPAPSSPPVALSHWQLQWEHHLHQNAQATQVFNDAVLHYNAAIAQFPANLLARAFGFKAARGL